VLCGKGGVGKSTLLMQIADFAARFGLRVVIVDLDANGAVSAMTGTIVPDGYASVREVLDGAMPASQVVRVPEKWQPISDRSFALGGVLLPGGCVHILPAPQNGLEDSTGKTGTEAETRLLVALAESGFGENYDLILVDAPGTEGPAFYLGLNACRNVLFPLQPETLGIRGFIRTIEAAIRFSKIRPINALGGVATMVRNKKEHKDTIADTKDWLHDQFGDAITLFDPPLADRAIVADAVPMMVPVSRMITRSGKYADVAAGYGRITLSTIAQIVSPERLDVIFDALEVAEMDDAVRDVLFGAGDGVDEIDDDSVAANI
jgi:chromosome partitioning protein